MRGCWGSARLGAEGADGIFASTRVALAETAAALPRPPARPIARPRPAQLQIAARARRGALAPRGAA
jgi:hypothetical protein